MADAELGTLLESHEGTLKERAQSPSAGDHGKFTMGAPGLGAGSVGIDLE